MEERLYVGTYFRRNPKTGILSIPKGIEFQSNTLYGYKDKSHGQYFITLSGTPLIELNSKEHLLQAESRTIVLPEELRINSERIAWLGVGNAVEVWNAEVWERVMHETPREFY